MQLLIVAEPDERRGLLVSLVTAAGHDAVATGGVRLLSALASLRPEAVVFDGVEDVERARRDVVRAREVLGTDVPLIVVVGGTAIWLRALPRDLVPAMALVEADLARTLDALAGVDASAARVQEAIPRGVLAWRPERREVTGPEGSAVLTASEATIVDLLARQHGRVVPAGIVARALWGEVILDRHGRAAIRSHVYTLRGKLRAIGLAGALVSLPGWGYRLEVAETETVASTR